MSRGSQPRLLVLHAMRLKGFVEADVVAERYSLPLAEVESELAALAEASLCQRRDGRISGWSLSADGRVRHADAVAAELDADCRSTVDSAYRRFVAVNSALLGVCTDWQLREVDGERMPNDHGDPMYDKGVLGRLRDIDALAQPICAELAGALTRFGSYGPRLSSALHRVEDGDRQWFTGPLVDSYHTVWFELHEDLLCTLGIERTKEGGSQ